MRFKDIHYLPRSLVDFPKARVFVLVFTNATCPLVQRYLLAVPGAPPALEVGHSLQSLNLKEQLT